MGRARVTPRKGNSYIWIFVLLKYRKDPHKSLFRAGGIDWCVISGPDFFSADNEFCFFPFSSSSCCCYPLLFTCRRRFQISLSLARSLSLSAGRPRRPHRAQSPLFSLFLDRHLLGVRFSSLSCLCSSTHTSFCPSSFSLSLHPKLQAPTMDEGEESFPLLHTGI